MNYQRKNRSVLFQLSKRIGGENMPTMLTIKEAAAKSGLSYGTIRRWSINGIFKGFVKAGSKTLINYDRFVEFLNGGGDDGARVD